MRRTGSNSLIEQQFKQYYGTLSLAAFSIVQNQEAAKDIVQDFFVWYCQNHVKVTIKTSFKSYALRAVKNLSYQHLEKKIKNDTLLDSLDVSEYILPKDLEKVDGKKKKIQQLLKKLPETQRNILISHVVQDMSYAEIAESRGISVNTVKTHMKRAYAFFRNYSMDKSFLSIFFTLLICCLINIAFLFA